VPDERIAERRDERLAEVLDTDALLRGPRDGQSDDADDGFGHDPQLAAVQLAILLEDVLDVILTDKDFVMEVLTDPEVIARLAGPGRELR
jgi:hypothetical protein